jgi:hypothetical protein
MTSDLLNELEKHHLRVASQNLRLRIEQCLDDANRASP